MQSSQIHFKLATLLHDATSKVFHAYDQEKEVVIKITDKS
jgi:hypothetical protein